MGFPAVQGRGMDRLPAGVTVPLEGALVREVDVDEVARAFEVAVHGLLAGIPTVKPALAQDLEGVLEELAETHH